jgi:hypothetical protein
VDSRIVVNSISLPTAKRSGATSETPSRAELDTAAKDTVQVATYPQDPYVGKSVVSEVPKSTVGTDMANKRVKITDNRPLMKPDAEGNFIAQPGTDGDTQINTLVTTNRTLAMWEKYTGGNISWSFGSSALKVTPHKKEGMNAYYSRWEAGTNYFYQKSNELNTVIKTGESADIVSHETGHAMLDGMKPGYLGSSDKETGAFHEAFGDCVAMLVTLQDPVNNELILAETGGDLTKQNSLAHLAEQFGIARKLVNTDPSDDKNAWLRNSINSFTYVTPESLGDGRGDDNTLGGEIHSFGRLFAGAFYDCLSAAYQHGVEKEALPPAQALKFAADTVGPLLARAVDRAPANRGRFKDMGLQMVKADKETNGGKLAEAFTKIFNDRKITQPNDFKAEEERLQSLPQVSVDHNFSSPEEASSFVSQRAEKLGLPAGQNYHSITVRINEDGEQVVNMLYTNTVPVNGVAGLEGLSTDINGGVTLVFDSKGKLADYRHNPIDEQAIHDEMEGIKLWAKTDRISPDMGLGARSSGTPEPVREDGQVYQAVIEGGKLVRIPASACNCGQCLNCQAC